jgi:hypothetical protein
VKTYVPPLKIDLHIHTQYSEDCRTPLSEVIQHAKNRGLNGVAITDHDTVRGALKLARSKDFLVIPGIEVSSLQGHILGLNITESIPPKLHISETVERIRRLGGIAVIAHPSVVIKTGLGARITSASDIDAVEVINASAFPFFISTYLGRRLAKRLALPQTAGSDAHHSTEIGSAYAVIDADSNVDDIVDAIRKGKITPYGRPISWIRRLARGSEGLRESLR